MRILRKLVYVCCSITLGLMALSSCEGGELYDVNAPDWRNVSVNLDKPVEGIHDLCFVFRDGEFKFDQWRFVR